VKLFSPLFYQQVNKSVYKESVLSDANQKLQISQQTQHGTSRDFVPGRPLINLNTQVCHNSDHWKGSLAALTFPASFCPELSPSFPLEDCIDFYCMHSCFNPHPPSIGSGWNSAKDWNMLGSQKEDGSSLVSACLDAMSLPALRTDTTHVRALR